MADLKLFIDTSSNRLLTGLTSTNSFAAASLPLFFGDTLNLSVYLLGKPADYNPNNPSTSTLTTISTAGLQLFVYLDDGTISGTVYTQQTVWQTDANNTYFYAALALNTAALQTLIGTGTGSTAWIKVGYVLNGIQTTVLSQQVTIGVGLPSTGLVVPAGQTPLSAEVASATYWSLNPVAGRPLYLESPNGKILALVAIDNADGTASLQASPMN